MRVLIICFSSVSNVACVVPQLSGLTKRYPQHHFAVLSRDFLAPLFDKLEGISFIGADIRHEDEGFKGAYRIYKRLANERFDAVIDMQCNWRSKFISRLLVLKGVKRYSISTNRRALNRLVRNGAEHSVPIKTIFERQRDTYKRLGLETDDSFERLPCATDKIRKAVRDLYGEKQGKWIGIAPLSTAKGKTLPFRKMKNVIQHFDNKPDTTIFLFGAGEIEKEMLSDWQSIYNHVHAVFSSRFSLDEELALMENLDVMVSMDAANVHLAALVGIPVVSVWGQTHPIAGFMGWKQSESNCIGVDFSCRPCSIRKDKECRYGDYRCLESIHSEKIINKIEEIIN